jgi:hypothetical protein
MAPLTTTRTLFEPRVGSYHRGDPLDIPLIDHHLLTQLLLPRVVSAIRFTFPQVYLDWTTGSGTNHGELVSGGSYNTLFWKRILEGILRTCLILGSCRRITSYSARRRRLDFSSSGSSKYSNEVYVATPSMKSFGVSIRTGSSDGGGSIIQQYGKVMALVLATVIVPSFYEELIHRRGRQLDERDRRLRLEEIRRELRSSMLHGTSVTYTAGDHHVPRRHHESTSPTSIEGRQQQQQHLLLLHQRAQERKSFVSSLIADTILGMGEVLLPPLQLFNYLMYLWGGCSTPDLAMRVAGWKYCRDPSSSVVVSARNGGDGRDDSNSMIAYDNCGEVVEHQQPHEGSFHQRHANFQYGHRRLLVEEALRAASLILPPRPNNAGSSGNAGGNAIVTVNSPRPTNRRINEGPREERSSMISGRSVDEEEEGHNSPHRGMRSR